jgi:hypothetical protein
MHRRLRSSRFLSLGPRARWLGALSALGLFAASGAIAACDDGAPTARTAQHQAQTGGGTPTWHKSPEAITQTIVRTWGIPLTDEERAEQIGRLRSALGGVRVRDQRSSLLRPNELFVLATMSLSTFVAGKLVAREAEVGATTPYLFEGLDDAETDEAGCFDDPETAWCDFRDEVRIGSLTDAGVDPTALPLAWRKRLMHNIQDIGEFFLLTIDDQLTMPAGDGGSAPAPHAPAFLLDEVFLPKLAEATLGGALTAEAEGAAWREVVTTILVGGGYFFEVRS